MPDPLLKLHDKGTDVIEAQGLLNRNGAILDPDGDFGKGTETAVREFQARCRPTGQRHHRRRHMAASARPARALSRHSHPRRLFHRPRGGGQPRILRRPVCPSHMARGRQRGDHRRRLRPRLPGGLRRRLVRSAHAGGDRTPETLARPQGPGRQGRPCAAHGHHDPVARCVDGLHPPHTAAGDRQHARDLHWPGAHAAALLRRAASAWSTIGARPWPTRLTIPVPARRCATSATPSPPVASPMSPPPSAAMKRLWPEGNGLRERREREAKLFEEGL